MMSEMSVFSAQIHYLWLCSFTLTAMMDTVRKFTVDHCIHVFPNAFDGFLP